MLLRIIGAVALACVCVTAGAVAQESRASGSPLVTRAFRLPAEMFSRPDISNVVGDRKENEGVKLLPSLPDELPGHRRFDVREYLTSLVGEISAEGEATFFEGAGALVVRASEEQMQLVEAAIGSPCCGPVPFVHVAFSLVQFTLKVPLDDSASLSYANLRQAAGDTWKVIDRQFLTTRSGIAVRHSSGIGNGESAFVSVPASGKAAGSTNHAKPREFAEMESGTRLEAEPVIGPDSLTVEVDLDYRHRSKANTSEAAYEHALTTSVSAWDGYPVVLQLVENGKGEQANAPHAYRALILKVQIVNRGGWNQRDQAAQKSALPPR